jgi:23S rRNA (cytosine1962-C5)-methyltransferase
MDNSPPKIILNKRIPSFDESGIYPHPWIFANSIASIDGIPNNGDTVAVFDKSRSFIGYGHYDELTGIKVRLLSFEKGKYPDVDFIIEKLKLSLSFRKKNAARFNSNAVRLVFSESDGLPGLIADKYGDIVVMQISTPAMEKFKTTLASFFLEAGFKTVFAADGDCEIRKDQSGKNGLVFLAGEPRTEDIFIEENGKKFIFSVDSVQKTGFYMDQRENRKILAKYASDGMKILDCFSFTGAFSVYMLGTAGGESSSVLIDSSEEVLALAEKNLLLNGADAARFELKCGDAFRILRDIRDRAGKFDMIILDPPKFAPYKSLLEKALRGYKDINILAMKMLKPGGLLATFSCSSALKREDFISMLNRASGDSKAKFRILEQFHQPADHPIALNFPESEYLKGFLLEKIS